MDQWIDDGRWEDKKMGRSTDSWIIGLMDEWIN
jgi:hypothetical protein